MSESEHAAALAHAIEGAEDACLGPTDIALVVRALRALAEGSATVAKPSGGAEMAAGGLSHH